MGQAQTRQLPPEFWSSPAVAAGLASCDFATLQEIRRFRREYSGQATSYVREFDYQLRTALQ